MGSTEDINKILLEAEIYRMQDEDKLDLLLAYLKENFENSFVAENEFHLEKLDHHQKKQLLEHLQAI